MNVSDGAHLDFVELPGRRSADPLGHVSSESSVRIVELTRTPGRTAHQHPHSEEVVYVEAGAGEVWIDGVRTPVSAGDIVRIPAGTPHATIPSEGNEMRLVCFFPHPTLSENIEDTTITVT